VGPGPGLSREERRILDLTSRDYRSVAELSARMRLPLGVVRVVVADLVGRGSVRLRAGSRRTVVQLPSRTVLESVLDGIATL
jgi:ribosomal protein S25